MSETTFLSSDTPCFLGDSTYQRCRKDCLSLCSLNRSSREFPLTLGLHSKLSGGKDVEQAKSPLYYNDSLLWIRDMKPRHERKKKGIKTV